MKKIKLDPEEQALLDSLDRDEWRRVQDFKAMKKRLQSAARHTFAKNRRVNLRLSEIDFNAAHVKSLEEGIPYQTLLSSIIHKYLMGRLVEKA